MRTPAIFLFGLPLVLLCTACVHQSDLPPIGPTPTPSAGTAALVANPSSMTLSASAAAPGGVFPSITVTQNVSSSPPVLVTAQSTCLSSGYTNIVSSTASGNSGTWQVQALLMGNCVLVFGGINGTTLIVPITITS